MNEINEEVEIMKEVEPVEVEEYEEV